MAKSKNYLYTLIHMDRHIYLQTLLKYSHFLSKAPKDSNDIWQEFF